MKPSSIRLTIFLLMVSLTLTLHAEDWSMWRANIGRTAQSTEKLPTKMSLLWERSLPALKPAYKNKRLQFDAGYEPIVKGKRLFVGSSHNDSMTAYDTETGKQLWRYFADGPIRFAPVAWKDRLLFGSDDGFMYCLNGADGKLIWKFRAVPSNRKVIGNGRLVSVWAIRGGPVVADDVIYFAAGVWAFEGIFVYALDAKTGRVKWLNDRTGHLYGQHPHDTKAFGGLTPQGYLVIAGDELIVPCGTAMPARFNRNNGKLISFAYPKAGRLPGGWFAAAAKARRRGKKIPKQPANEIVFDQSINKDRHEDNWRQGAGKKDLRSIIHAGEKEYPFENGFATIKKDIHSMIAADGKMFVVTKDGKISCFGKKTSASIVYPAKATTVQQPPTGYCLLWGINDLNQIKKLLKETQYQIIGIDSDAKAITGYRQILDARGDYGRRVTLHVGTPHLFRLPPYLANRLICNEHQSEKVSSVFLKSLIQTLRPYGGTAEFPAPADQTLLNQLVVQNKITLQEKDGITKITRSGALPGSTNYTGGWKSNDALVKAPLGLLWYGDEVGNFKRAPQPMFVDGVMVSYNKLWKGFPKGERPPYKLSSPTFSDVYTGRVLTAGEISASIKKIPLRDITQPQPTQYRPERQKNAWSPKKPVVGERVNPLTGLKEPRQILKAYGCDGGNDYGSMFTVRSGTAAFYDKRIESGTIHIGGPRSGCTNSIIPANGILNVPYFYQGCTCSYPLPVGLAMINMPDQHEQWTVWGAGKQKGTIQRVGINLGAPGDRVTNKGTLWLDYPVVGGPSPKVDITLEPKSAKPWYHNSLWMKGGNGWAWVASSGMTGLEKITLKGLKPTTYTLRLYFTEPTFSSTEKRVMNIAINGTTVENSLDINKATGGTMRSIVKEYSKIKTDGTLEITLTATQGKTIVSGIELVADGLEMDKVPVLKGRS